MVCLIKKQVVCWSRKRVPHSCLVPGQTQQTFIRGRLLHRGARAKGYCRSTVSLIRKRILTGLLRQNCRTGQMIRKVMTESIQLVLSCGYLKDESFARLAKVQVCAKSVTKLAEICSFFCNRFMI